MRVWLALLAGCVCTPGLLWAQYFPELQWHRFYGGAREDRPARLRLAPDSTLLLVGTTTPDEGCLQGYVLRVDARKKGTPVWTRTLGAPDGCSELRDAILSNDQESILYAGTTGQGLRHDESQQGIYAQDYWVGRLDLSGATDWSKTFGGSKPDQCMAIAPTTFGGFVLNGGAWSQDHDLSTACASLNNLWVVTLSKFAQHLRSLCLGGSKNDWGVDVIATQDGGHLLLGYTTSEDLDGSRSRANGDAWLLKLNAAGEVEWQRVLKEPYEDVLNRVVQTKYGMYAAVGSSFDAKQAKQFWFVKFDQTGRLLADKKWGGKGFEELTGVYPTWDGGFICTGWSYYYTLDNLYVKGQRDLWVIRLDPEGNLIWQQTYGGPDDEEGVDVVEASRGVFYVLGKKHNTFAPDGKSRGDDFWLLKVRERPCADMQVLAESNHKKSKLAPGEAIRFVNKSQHLDRWKWDFGDGTTSTEHSPIKKYDAPGVYVVRLTGYANEGCQKTYLYPSPITVKE
jgi:hypothetical protein